MVSRCARRRAVAHDASPAGVGSCRPAGPACRPDEPRSLYPHARRHRCPAHTSPASLPSSRPQPPVRAAPGSARWSAALPLSRSPHVPYRPTGARTLLSRPRRQPSRTACPTRRTKPPPGPGRRPASERWPARTRPCRLLEASDAPAPATLAHLRHRPPALPQGCDAMRPAQAPATAGRGSAVGDFRPAPERPTAARCSLAGVHWAATVCP